MSHNPSIIPYLRQSTIYEANIRQFSEQGDFASFQVHLPRLQAMGIDIIWLMPIHPIGQINRKGSLGSYYSSQNFLDINPEFGTKDDFRNLVNEAHRLDMKIIIDWVANHAAWDNVWTQDHPEYFLRDDQGRFLSPYDWSDVIQINHQQESAHDALREAMCYWVKEFDIDGFRADLAHLTPLRFWLKARNQTESLKPNLIWLAETEDVSYYEAFDIIYAWKWMHQSEAVCKNQLGIHSLISCLKDQSNGHPPKALQLFFTANHDENSWNGTEYEKYGVYAKAMAVFSFTFMDAVPLMYNGQEIPHYKRLQFFDKDQLDWRNPPMLTDFYSTLIRLHKNICHFAVCKWLTVNDQVLAYQRGEGKGSVIILLQLNPAYSEVRMGDDFPAGTYKEIFSGQNHLMGPGFHCNMQPGDYWVLESI